MFNRATVTYCHTYTFHSGMTLKQTVIRTRIHMCGRRWRLYYRTFIYLYVQVKTIWEEQFYTNEQGPHGEHQELRNVMLHPVIEWRGLSVHLPETVS